MFEWLASMVTITRRVSSFVIYLDCVYRFGEKQLEWTLKALVMI
jgi:hypothetical protein